MGSLELFETLIGWDYCTWSTEFGKKIFPFEMIKSGICWGGCKQTKCPFFHKMCHKKASMTQMVRAGPDNTIYKYTRGELEVGGCHPSSVLNLKKW